MNDKRTYTVTALMPEKPLSVCVDGEECGFTYENRRITFDAGTGRQAIIRF